MEETLKPLTVHAWPVPQMPSRSHPAINLINHATADVGCDLGKLADALDNYVIGHLWPAWGVSAAVIHNPSISGCYTIFLVDDANQAGVLGYHDRLSNGMPYGVVLVKPALQYEGTISLALSHELAEMLVDPGCNLTAADPLGNTYALEICDPCQTTHLEINGFTMSNFVYPSWYQGWKAGQEIAFDRLHLCKRPFELLPGGYISMRKKGSRTWTPEFADKDAHRHFRKRKALNSRTVTRAAGMLRLPASRETLPVAS